MRTFIAVPIPGETRDQLKALEARLKSASGGAVRWVEPGIIHLTLKFLGEVNPHHLDRISAELERIAALAQPAMATVSGTGVFPAWNKPRVFWAGLSTPPELLTLFKQVDEVTAALGFPSENRPFNAHLTLGRIHDSMTPFQLAALKEKMTLEKENAFGTIPLDQIVFFQSILQPAGPVYKPISIHRLIGKG